MFAADESMISNSSQCANLSSSLIKKFESFATDCEWILNESHNLENYEFLHQRYDLWLRHKGFRSYSGRTWHKELYMAIVEHYGEIFLKEIYAYEEIYPAWLNRILFYSDKMQHPMFHILLTSFLAGSTQNFFEGCCPETLPYGKGPCHVETSFVNFI